MRIAVCGTAHWSEIVHLPGLAAHVGVELAGVYGRTPERREALAQKFGIAAYAEVDAMLDDVDAVSFVVPPAVQADLAARAARADKHLLLEKPLAANFPDAVRLANNVADAGVAASCFLTRQFIAALTYLAAEARITGATDGQAVLRSGALLPGSPYENSTWRHDELGALWDAAPHGITVLHDGLGLIVRVRATSPKRGIVKLAYEHASGAQSSHLVDLVDPATELHESYAFNGGATPLTIDPVRYERPVAFAGAVDLLLARVRQPDPGQLSLVLHIMAVLDAAERSARNGGAFETVSPTPVMSS